MRPLLGEGRVTRSTKSRGLLPDPQPLLKDRATLLGDAVVAAGRAGVGRNDAACEQSARAHVAQDRIERALLDDVERGGNGLQLFGDLVAVQVFVGPIEDRKQDESNQPRIQLALKLLLDGFEASISAGCLFF